MPTADPCWVTAADLAAAIKKKQVSPVEVVDAVLARIEKTKRLNAYCLVDADGARDAANAAERALMKKGAKLGPIGLQIVGRRFADTTVLRAAAAFEAARPWAQHRPAEID